MTEQPKQSSSDKIPQVSTVLKQHQARPAPSQVQQQGGFNANGGQMQQSDQVKQPRFTDWASI